MSDRFYRRWILANAWAEGLGLGTTLLLGVLAGRLLETRPDPAAVLLGALAAVLLGTTLEGVVVGIAQGRVLRERIPSLSLADWVVATAVGAGVAWSLGMVPSTFLALSAVPEPRLPAGAPPVEPPAWAQYSLALLMGLVLGPVLALAQVRVLRRFARRPHRWLGANALAWGAGMAAIFIGMDRVPWSGGAVPVLVAVVAVCVLAGAIVGAVHGRFLVRLLPAGIQGHGGGS